MHELSNEAVQQLLDIQLDQSQVGLDLFGESAFARQRLPDYENHWRPAYILGDSCYFSQFVRVGLQGFEVLLVFEVVNAVLVGHWEGIRWLQERERVQLAVDALRDQLVLQNGIDLFKRHLPELVGDKLFPSVVDQPVDQADDFVKDLVGLPLAVDEEGLDVEALKAFGKFLDLAGLGLPLLQQLFLVLVEHVLELRAIRVLLVERGRLLELFAGLQGLLPGLLDLLQPGLPPLLL